MKIKNWKQRINKFKGSLKKVIRLFRLSRMMP